MALFVLSHHTPEPLRPPPSHRARATTDPCSQERGECSPAIVLERQSRRPTATSATEGRQRTASCCFLEASRVAGSPIVCSHAARVHAAGRRSERSQILCCRPSRRKRWVRVLQGKRERRCSVRLALTRSRQARTTRFDQTQASQRRRARTHAMLASSREAQATRMTTR